MHGKRHYIIGNCLKFAVMKIAYFEVKYWVGAPISQQNSLGFKLPGLYKGHFVEAPGVCIKGI